MNILVLTGYHGNKYSIAGPISSRNKSDYASKHGYDFLCLRSSYKEYKDPISWHKIEWIRKNIDNWDWIFWSDADAVITNNDIKLEDLINCKAKRPETLNVSPVAIPQKIEIPPEISTDYVIAYDDYSPCMGNFLIKNSVWSKLFFDKILALKSRFYNDPIWDNRAQDYLFDKERELTSHVKFIPQNLINSGVHQFKQGDFLIHFFATAEKWRLERFVNVAANNPNNIIEEFNKCEVLMGRSPQLKQN